MAAVDSIRNWVTLFLDLAQAIHKLGSGKHAKRVDEVLGHELQSSLVKARADLEAIHKFK